MRIWDSMSSKQGSLVFGGTCPAVKCAECWGDGRVVEMDGGDGCTTM